MSVVSALGNSRMVELPDGVVRVYERGEGEPIVFIHGLFANAAAWRKVVPLLADRYRCVTADWPFGAHQTPMTPGADLTPSGIADTIADVIEHLDLHNVTLVGNDGGGMLAQLVITRSPSRIGRLVLTPCDAYENFPPPLFEYLCTMARVPASLHLFSALLRVPAVRRMFGRSLLGYGGLSHTRIDDDLLDHYLRGLMTDRGVRRDTIEFLRSVDNRYTLEAAAKFGDFAQPVLIAWAPDDRFFPFTHAERFDQDFRDARLETIADSLTWVAEDQPGRTAELIDAFIRDTAVWDTAVRDTALPAVPQPAEDELEPLG